MYIQDGIFREMKIKMPAPIAEGTIVTKNGTAAAADGSDAYGIVTQPVEIIPLTGRIYVAVSGTVDMESPDNCDIDISDEMKLALHDFKFVPGLPGGGGGGEYFAGHAISISAANVISVNENELDVEGYTAGHAITISPAGVIAVNEDELEKEVFVATYNTTTTADIKAAMAADKCILVKHATTPERYVCYKAESSTNTVTLHTMELSDETKPRGVYVHFSVTGAAWTAQRIPLARQDELPLIAKVNTTTATDIRQAISDKRAIIVDTGNDQPLHTVMYSDRTSDGKAYLITAHITTDTERWNRKRPAFNAYTVDGSTWTASDPLEAVIEDDLVNIVTALPATGVAKTRYLLKVTDNSTEGYHLDEYIWEDNKWIAINPAPLFLATIGTTTEASLKAAIADKQDIIITDGADRPYHAAALVADIGMDGVQLAFSDVITDTDRWDRKRHRLQVYTVKGSTWTAADPIDTVVAEDLVNVVTELPTAGVENTRYLLKVTDTSDAGFHLEEYVYDATEQEWVKINPSSAGDSIIDVTTLPTTEIERNVVYRIHDQYYTFRGERIPETTLPGYKTIDLQCEITENGISFGGTTYSWGSVTDELVTSFINQGRIATTDVFAEADFFYHHYQEQGDFGPDDLYYAWHEEFEDVDEGFKLYHNPTGTAAGYILIGGSGQVDEVTTTEVNGKIQANAVIDVTALPTTGIKANSLYRKPETVTISNPGWFNLNYHGGDIPVPEPLTAWRSVNGSFIISASGIEYLTDSWAWADITDTDITRWRMRGYIQEVAMDFPDMAMAMYVDEGTEVYDYGGHFEYRDTPIVLTMNKLFQRVNGAWEGISSVSLSQEQYDALTEAQKMDGTLYVVEEE